MFVALQASKKPFLGVFGKLMGRKGPDASHPKDQVSQASKRSLNHGYFLHPYSYAHK